MSVRLTCQVNGRRIDVPVRASVRLSEFLRETLGLTGTHVACGDGVCGSCTVVIDGATARSCLLLAAQCGDAVIETVEGIAQTPLFEAIRDAFLRHGAVQCGFCTPGFVTTIAAMVADHANDRLSEAEIGDRLASVACRCTGYVPIVTAARDLLRRDP